MSIFRFGKKDTKRLTEKLKHFPGFPGISMKILILLQCILNFFYLYIMRPSLGKSARISSFILVARTLPPTLSGQAIRKITFFFGFP